MGSLCQVNLGALDALGSVGSIGCATSPIHVSQDFPLRWPTITFGITKTDSSEAEKAKPEDEPAAAENGPGTYKVTQLASGRSARIPGNSLEDVQNKVLTKYPDSSLEDYSFELEQEQQENIL